MTLTPAAIQLIGSVVWDDDFTVVTHVPNYYRDKEAHRRASQAHRRATYQATTAVRAGILTGQSNYFDLAARPLDLYAGVRQISTAADTPLVYAYSGQRLVGAATVLERLHPTWNPFRFKAWCHEVYKPLMGHVASRWFGPDRYSNRGAWATLGRLMAAIFTRDEGLEDECYAEARRWADYAIDARGELWIENLRLTSGMSYTYFALAPMSRVALLARERRGQADLWGRVLFAMETFWRYCLRPETWPYSYSLLSKLLRPFVDCAETTIVPSRRGEPANLFEVVGFLEGRADWHDWGVKPLNDSFSIYTGSTVTVERGDLEWILFL